MAEIQKVSEQREGLTSYFFVIRQLAAKDLKRGNTSKILGQIWYIITPIVSMLTMSLLFSTVFHRDFRTFIPFVFTGTIMYGFYNNGMRGCLSALSGNKNLMIRTKIPKNILLVEKVYVAFIQMLFSVVGYVIALILTGTAVGPFVFLTPVVIVLSSVIIIGIGKILAVINVYFADISYFYNIVMQFVFYASAVIFSAERLSPVMQKIIMFNPIYLSITFARACILYNAAPAFGIWFRLVVYAIVIYIVGSLIFRKGSQDVVAKL